MLTKEVKVTPYPDGKTLRHSWYLHGKNGTVQFVYVESSNPDWRNISRYALDVGYHWDFDVSGYGLETDECDCRPSGQCWYDGSGLAADRLFNQFVEQGSDIIWETLTKRYNDIEAVK